MVGTTRHNLLNERSEAAAEPSLQIWILLLRVMCDVREGTVKILLLALVIRRSVAHIEEHRLAVTCAARRNPIISDRR